MSEEIQPPLVQPIKAANTDNSQPDFDDKAIFGLSLRGYITSLFALTACGMALFSIPVEETIKSALFITLGFYFGKSNK